MNNFFRALIAGYGAKKIGGGCLSTIIVFAIIWWALGTCNNNQQAVPQRVGTNKIMKLVTPQETTSIAKLELAN